MSGADEECFKQTVCKSLMIAGTIQSAVAHQSLVSFSFASQGLVYHCITVSGLLVQEPGQVDSTKRLAKNALLGFQMTCANSIHIRS